MRNAFINAIYDEAKNNKNLYLITGDLGFGVLTKFWEDYPDRFINAGICEQNMTAMAAGLAMSGKTVFTYSIANFLTLRCYEQIRNDVAYHLANVKMVAVGGGFAYGSMGMTHHGTEDIAAMRAIPDMTIFTPSDPISAIAAARDAIKLDGPCYIRLERGGEPEIFENDVQFNIGEPKKICVGCDVAILVVGSIVSEAIKAANIVKKKGITVSVYSVYTIKPFIKSKILDIVKKHKKIITLEEHNIIGGLGSAVAEMISDAGIGRRLIRLGLQDEFTAVVGSRSYLREVYKLSASDIVNKILDK